MLTTLLILPLLGAIATLIVRNRTAARWTALGVSLGALAWSLSLLFFFDFRRTDRYAYAPAGGSVQLVQDAVWVPAFNVHYKVGIDGLSLPLLLLTTFVVSLSIVASWTVKKMHRAYLALILVLESCVLAAFVSLDLLQFYVFFEISLLPMYFLIGIWGGPKKEAAAIKFFLYTLLGSVALLVGIIGIYVHSKSAVAGGTLDVVRLADPAVHAAVQASLGPTLSNTIFALLMVGFLVKLPAVPLHTWLPDAHVEAATPVSMILAAVLLKLGAYGILRVAYPLFPEAARALWFPVSVVGGVSLIYGALCAMGQTDYKRLVAYSSVSHMGLVTLGIAVLTVGGWNGAVFMMLSHGLTSAMLFFIVGVVYDRLHHRNLNRLGGLAGKMPTFTGFGILATFANLGLPGLCGFEGEILVLLGTFAAASPDSVLYRTAGAAGHLPAFVATVRVLGLFACFNLVLTAGYMLRSLQKVFYGRPATDVPILKDLTGRELSVLIPLAALVVLLGIFPTILVFALTSGTLSNLLRLF